MIILIWIAGIFVVACGITGVAICLNDLVTNWSHAKRMIDQPLEEPHPNYWHIAQLERELFGRTFHNPDSEAQCKCDQCRYRVTPVDPNASDAYKYGLPSWGDREGE